MVLKRIHVDQKQNTANEKAAFLVEDKAHFLSSRVVIQNIKKHKRSLKTRFDKPVLANSINPLEHNIDSV